MASLTITRYTPGQYLKIERAATIKSEYVAGEMVAMSGVSRRHSLINSNISRHLGNQLAGRQCEVHRSDLRTNVGADFFYPDIVIVCGEPNLLDDDYSDTLLNPMVIVEVLSRSTELYDRGTKFTRYARIDSLTDYVLVSQDGCRVEHFTRLSDGEWPTAVTITDPDGMLEIASIGCRLRMTDIYDQIYFE
jgi:Uma2 family endonuclease